MYILPPRALPMTHAAAGDWLDYLGAFSGLMRVLLSVAAIVCAARQLPMADAAARDWLDYIGAFSGLVGALLAAVAIAYAARQSVQAKREVVRERRTEFELRLLADIRYQMSITQLQHLAGYVGALIVDPEDETDLPLLRAAIGVKAGPLGEDRRAKVIDHAKQSGTDVSSALTKEAAGEVDEAISRRLTK